MDVCDGGTINSGSTSITFTNNKTSSCTITSCTLAGWPTTDPVVPAKQGLRPWQRDRSALRGGTSGHLHLHSELLR